MQQVAYCSKRPSCPTPALSRRGQTSVAFVIAENASVTPDVPIYHCIDVFACNASRMVTRRDLRARTAEDAAADGGAGTSIVGGAFPADPATQRLLVATSFTPWLFGPALSPLRDVSNVAAKLLDPPLPIDLGELVRVRAKND